jgi:hypothetical protein
MLHHPARFEAVILGRKDGDGRNIVVMKPSELPKDAWGGKWMDSYRAVPYIPNYQHKVKAVISVQYQADRASILGGTYWKKVPYHSSTNLAGEDNNKEESVEEQWVECARDRKDCKNLISTFNPVTSTVLEAVASVARFDWATFNGTPYRFEYIELEDDDLGPIAVAKELTPKIFITKCSLLMHDSSGIANAFKVEAKHDVKLGGVKLHKVSTTAHKPTLSVPVDHRNCPSPFKPWNMPVSPKVNPCVLSLGILFQT